MTQKLLIGGLALAIVAVIGFGLADAGRVTPETEMQPVALAATAMSTAQPTQMPTIAVPETIASSEPMAQPAVEREPVVQAQSTMGEAWQAEGTIAAIEDFGFTLKTETAEYFIELGPPTYWQAQDMTLNVGDAIQVNGYYNGEQVHARVVSANGAEMVIRSESGQPMWAGGVDRGNESNGQQGQASTHAQVAPEDWLTLTGSIGKVSNGQVTLNVNDGNVLNLQMGRPDFWQSQGITLSVGDPVEVLGFWSGDQFMAGDIRKTATGETIMLRDPNGRQLWSGPGRNGNSNQGGGNSNQGGNGNNSGNQGGNGQQGNSNGNQGGNNQQSNSNGNQGGGNGYQGGRDS